MHGLTLDVGRGYLGVAVEGWLGGWRVERGHPYADLCNGEWRVSAFFEERGEVLGAKESMRHLTHTHTHTHIRPR